MAYTNSSMVVYKKLSPNHSGQRTHSIDRITPHCVVGQCTAEGLGEWFEKQSTQASSNYGIDRDGRVALYVEEKNRSWCSSSNANDQRAITIECASDTTEPYAFRDVVYKKLIELCIDICKRNGKNKLIWFGDKDKTLNYSPKSGEMILTVHRWFANKSCPGNWMYARMGDLADKVTAALQGSSDSGGGSVAKGTQASVLKNLSEADAIKKVAVNKAISESMQLIAQCTEESYKQALALFDAIAESKCITPGKARDYKKDVECQYAVLKYLRENLDVCSYTDIQTAARGFMGFGWRTGSLDQLVTAGLIEKHAEGYCWPGAKEEKERLLREAEERRQRELRQRAAYKEACSRVETQINEEVASKAAGISEEFDSQLRGIRREIDEINAENNRQRQSLEQQISDWRRQQSSLGFFKGKEKRALQAQIDDAQRKIGEITSAQQVEASFKTKMDQVNNAKESAIESIRAEVCSKYPMPKYEDFAE